ncbi:MAG: extracellular solute-binding protein, partial [Pseudomonadota bacterium]
GQNNFDIWRVDYYRDAQVAIEAFKAGEYDFRAENSSKAWATAYEIPARTRGDLITEEIPHDRPAGMQGFVYNLRKPIFQDVAVRQALAFAFDFEWSNETLFYGQYARTRSFFDNSEMAATGLPSAEELELLEPLRDDLPAEVFDASYAPPTTDDGSLRSNMRKAVELLQSAGWSVTDGVMTRESDGATLEFEILLVSPLFERIALPFAENLKRIGVIASVRTVDTAQYRRRLDAFDFDMVVSTWGQSESPGNEQRDFWSSEAAERNGSRNLAGLESPAIDALVEALIAAPDRDALVTRTRALDRALQWSFIVIPQWHTTYDRIARWDVFGRPERNPRRGVSVSTWWIDPEKAAALNRGG